MPALDLPLRDVHEPAAVDWWPPAIGWWLVLIALPMVIGLAYWLYRYFNRRVVIRTARKQLAAIVRDRTLDDLCKLRALSVLIRRVAISLAPRQAAAAITGSAWLNYLDRSVDGEPFFGGAGRFLADAPYAEHLPPDVDIEQLIALCEKWLKSQSKR